MPESFDLKALLTAAKQLASENKIDLSSDEDLSLAVMNLVSIEEHLFYSGAKTNDATYYELIGPVRELRKNYLKQLLPAYEGEVWCISKHLLAAAMRLMEVGTKRQERDPGAAQACFRDAYTLYAYFWMLKLKMATGKSGAPATSVPPSPTNQKAMEDFLAKLVDCCGE